MNIYENCPICGGKISERMNVPNWIFSKMKDGKSSYRYCRCSDCGCLFREQKEVDYPALYDERYGEPVFDKEKGNFSANLKQGIKRIRDSYSYMNKHKIIGRAVRHFRNPKYTDIELYRERLERGESFLDVGCRYGDMINEMREAGADAHGIEPYIEKDIYYLNGTVVRKMFISEINRKFDIIFYNNVFEHLDNPADDMKMAASKLTNDGMIGLVFPAQGGLTEHFNENAFVIQAPQHTFLHTEASIKKVLEDAGLIADRIIRKTIEKWYYKSYFLQENMEMKDSDNPDQSRLLVSESVAKQIDEWVKDSEANNKGDYYHVMAKKRKEF